MLFSPLPGIFYVCYSYSPTSPHLGECCWRLLGVENTGGCIWEEVTSMGQHHRLKQNWAAHTPYLQGCSILRPVTCSHWVTSPAPLSVALKYCWTSYTLQLNKYFWISACAERYDGAKRTKQRTGTLEEHSILGSQNGQLLSFRNSYNISFHVRSGELQRVAGERS